MAQERQNLDVYAQLAHPEHFALLAVFYLDTIETYTLVQKTDGGLLNLYLRLQIVTQHLCSILDQPVLHGISMECRKSAPGQNC